MPGPDGTWNWPHEMAQTLGGMLAMAIVGVLTVASLAWDWWTRRRQS